MLDSKIELIIALTRSALKGEKYEFDGDFDYNYILKMATAHQMYSMLYTGAVNLGADKNAPQMRALFDRVCKSIMISDRQLHQINRIMKAFEDNRIDHLALKGIILKSMYPEAHMRLMGDADILIRLDQIDECDRVMAELGFEKGPESNHELIYTHKDLLVELHKRTIPSYNKDYYAYFGDGWEKAIKYDSTKSRYTYNPEDEFIFIFTHFAKHYRDSGIGFRHLCDLWVYLNKRPNLNDDYMKSEMQKLCLYDFYMNIRDALMYCFENGDLTEKAEFILNNIFSGGAYGTREANRLSDAVKMSKGKTVRGAWLKKVIKIACPPYKTMTERYSVLKKIPVLLPIFWIVNWVEILLFRRKNIKKRTDEIRALSVEKIENYQQGLNYVGLDFNFEE